MKNLRTVLSSRLRELMAATPALDTQVKLAKKAGVSQSTVQRILACEHGATLDVLEDLGRAFGFKPPALILFDTREAEFLSVWMRLGERDRTELLQAANLLIRQSMRNERRSTMVEVVPPPALPAPNQPQDRDIFKELDALREQLNKLAGQVTPGKPKPTP